MMWLKLQARRFVAWIAIKMGLRVINDAEYRRGIDDLSSIVQYVEMSGALAHPRRIQARKEIREGLREVLSILAIGEYRVTWERRQKIFRWRLLRNLRKEAA